jgi:two-component system response regulator DctR
VEARVCLIDDDESIRDSLDALFRSRRLRVSVYADPVRFLSIWKSSELREVPAAIVLDIRMPVLSGLEVFEQMRSYGLPDHNSVLFLTGHGDIPLAVEAIRNGAADFLEKPFSDNSLVDRVIKSMRHVEALFAESSKVLRLTEQLSLRERHIAQLIVNGSTNRDIAAQLAISVRTVEVHRSHIFEKLGIKNAIELVTHFRAGFPATDFLSGHVAEPP